MSLTALAFVILFLALCVLAFVRHPIWGAALYVAMFFVSPQGRWWGQGAVSSVRWSYVAAVVTICALLFTRHAAPPAVPLRRQAPFWLMLLFSLWLVVQYFWALDPAEHWLLTTYYFKFIVALALIYRCLDSERSLKILLWTHYGCAFYFGWIAYTSFGGGRFENFGGGALDEANAAALALGSGVLVGASLFLAGTLRQKGVVLFSMPFVINGIVATVSRSGSLALLMGGLVFNMVVPRKLAGRVRILSVLAAVLFGMLAGTAYWTRMQSLESAGEQVQGLDTGADRVMIMKAQLKMFSAYPLGCGATCTAVLSPQYLDQIYLAQAERPGETRERASHNTFLTMLVEHGIVGAAFYLLMLLWTVRALLKLAKAYRERTDFVARVFPGVAGLMMGITVADMFVSYARFEIRYWFVAVLMSMLAQERSGARVPAPAGTAAAPLPTAPQLPRQANATAAAGLVRDGSGNPADWR